METATRPRNQIFVRCQPHAVRCREGDAGAPLEFTETAARLLADTGRFIKALDAGKLVRCARGIQERSSMSTTHLSVRHVIESDSGMERAPVPGLTRRASIGRWGF